MRELLFFVVIFEICSFANGAEVFDPMEIFVEDIVKTWKLRLPTIVLREKPLNLCRNYTTMHCVINDVNSRELAQHLSSLHCGKKQDGLILAGTNGHEELVSEISENAPTILRSNCAVFMPEMYSSLIHLRLDSNVVFYNGFRSTKPEHILIDMFAVKGGPEITINLGKWKMHHGITLENGLNRWERRVDLNGATLVNGLFSTNWAQLVKTAAGTVVDSNGFFPDMLFYVTDRLNMTTQTFELPNPKATKETLKNGTWSGAFGFLQRKEIDVDVCGRGISSVRSSSFDFPLPMIRNPRILIAGRPSGTAPNMWVYVRVFGILQWSLFLAALCILLIGLTLINVLNDERPEMSYGIESGSRPQYQETFWPGVALLYQFTLQMGSHPDSTKPLATRLLTLSVSILTLLMFVSYTNDITAEMTSGPAPIPVKNFEDVLFHDYNVIVSSGFYKKLLALSPPGSAKYMVYKLFLEPQDKLPTVDDAFRMVTEEEKVLYYYGLSSMVSKNAKPYQSQLIALKMAEYSIASLALQKDSEFHQIFDYYILKGLESGIFRKIYIKHHMGLYTNKFFGLTEPEALGSNNVMFLFMFLGLGILVSVCIMLTELVHKRWFINLLQSGMLAWSDSATY